MVEKAEELVREAESAYAALDIDRIMNMFHPDIVFFWNGELTARGLDPLRRWHERSFANLHDYRIHKTLRAASGDTIAVEWTDSWVDRSTGLRREGYGAEFWTMEGLRLRRWHAYWRGHGPAEAGATRLDTEVAG